MGTLHIENLRPGKYLIIREEDFDKTLALIEKERPGGTAINITGIAFVEVSDVD